MGYANQFIGGGDGRESARRLANAGASGVIVADLTPDEGGPFEAVAPGARPRGRLPRRADDAAATAAPRSPKRSGGFLYCVSLVGVTGARDAARSVGRAARPGRRRPHRRSRSRVGFGVSKPAHVRALAKAGADGVIVASALVDALGEDGRDVDAMGRLVGALAAATGRRA